ncbi:HEAT repeat domain-containing protein [Streptomyces uncialis]|uniref:HEAT repeat domain-containing protein n=1 Tax=Streptomyces uncialis TaxID=1048205 RepID=UPI0022554776|nr:HEAT repeat domain-containing protein [Streptomyces uncialis]MCX4659577.1 HEAT repeat domain-containing protein [Streptomyces uncialis]WTE15049.1 HEAT repeat domain-containing protein [Streptomyces uncialis]
MAIDLRRKSPADLAEGRANGWADTVEDPVLLEDLGTEQREALNFAYRTTLSNVDPRFVAGDPAAWASDFGYALDRVAIRLDNRSNEELRRAALQHADPAMREQALFEYADRDHADAIELLAQAIRQDTDRQVRWDALWAVEKLGGPEAIAALRQFLDDPDPEIAEWSKLFISELQTGDPAFDDREGSFTPGRTFDETIFLLIHCDLYVRLDPSNQHWGKISLAPQGLARIYGQAHACPNVATREKQLVIAKTIEGLHADGTPHVDNYLFRGFTERSRRDRGNFFFESLVPRPFFKSGRADDPSEGVREANIGFARYGTWHLDPKFQVHGEAAIRYVRGRFQGWGHVNLSRIAGRSLEEILVPGNGVLSTLHDEEVGPMTNAFILGTFKGKLNDWDGDGVIDLNSRDVYSTADGDIDTDQDGIPDQAGLTCCDWTTQQLP